MDFYPLPACFWVFYIVLCLSIRVVALGCSSLFGRYCTGTATGARAPLLTPLLCMPACCQPPAPSGHTSYSSMQLKGWVSIVSLLPASPVCHPSLALQCQHKLCSLSYHVVPLLPLLSRAPHSPLGPVSFILLSHVAAWLSPAIQASAKASVGRQPPSCQATLALTLPLLNSPPHWGAGAATTAGAGGTATRTTRAAAAAAATAAATTRASATGVGSGASGGGMTRGATARSGDATRRADPGRGRRRPGAGFSAAVLLLPGRAVFEERGRYSPRRFRLRSPAPRCRISTPASFSIFL